MKLSELVMPAAIVSLIFWGGCQLIHLYNEQEATKDANKIFNRHNVTVESLACQSKDLDSEAVCTFKANPQQLEKLVKGLNIKQIEPNASSEDVKQHGSGAFRTAEKEWSLYKLQKAKDKACWAKLSARTDSQIDLYGRIDGYRFEVFYANQIETGCFSIFYSIG